MFIYYALVFLIFSIPSSIHGSISIWNKNIFFGHYFSHFLLLPPIICLILGYNSKDIIFLSNIIFSVLFGMLLLILNKLLEEEQNLILFISSLILTGLSMLLSSKNPSIMNDYIFGDLLLINNRQIIYLSVFSLASIYFIFKYHDLMLLYSINKDLGKIKNNNINIIYGIHYIMQGIIITMGVQIFGILLVSNAIMAPPILMQIVSKSPVNMIKGSILLSVFTSITGLIIGLKINSSPSSIITIIYGGIAIAILVYKYISYRNKNSNLKKY